MNFQFHTAVRESDCQRGFRWTAVWPGGFETNSRTPAPQSEKSSPRAFTLIEIMVAISIFTLVMVSIYSTWSAVLRAAKVGTTAAAEAQRTRMALQVIEESLGAMQFFTVNLPYYAFFADTSQTFAALSFVARLPASFPGSGMFRGLPVRRVTFQVEPGPAGSQLVMKQTPLLEPADPTVEPYKIVLAPQISQFKLEFWDQVRTFDWIPEWYYTNQPPRLVRVSVGFGDARQGTARVSTRVIDVHLMAIPAAFQVPQLPTIPPVFAGNVGGRTPAGGNNRPIPVPPGAGTGHDLFNPFPNFQLPTPPPIPGKSGGRR